MASPWIPTSRAHYQTYTSPTRKRATQPDKPFRRSGGRDWGVENLVLHYEVLHPGFVALTPQREGDAPAEPDVLTTARLGGSLALPTLRLKQKR